MAERYPDRKETASSWPGNRKTDESKKSKELDWRSEAGPSRSNPEKPNWRKDGEQSGQGSGNRPWRSACSSSPQAKMQNSPSGYKTDNQKSSQRQNIFGGATPVDTRKRDEEIERKLKAEEFQVSKKSGAKGRKLEEKLSRSKEAPNYADKNPYSTLAKFDDI